MYWYVIHVKQNRDNQLIDFFCDQDIDAFIPKMEQWYSIKGKKDYVLKDLYPHYVFIRTDLDSKQFHALYHEFFQSINGFALLLEFDDIYALTNKEQQILEQMLKEDHVIHRSVGNIIDSILKVDEGPLVGMEDNIIHINRHKRVATLKMDSFIPNMKVPLEVVSKS